MILLAEANDSSHQFLDCVIPPCAHKCFCSNGWKSRDDSTKVFKFKDNEFNGRHQSGEFGTEELEQHKVTSTSKQSKLLSFFLSFFPSFALMDDDAFQKR